MSKLNMDVLRECIHEIITGRKKERKFTETVELQVMLKVDSRGHQVGLRPSEG